MRGPSASALDRAAALLAAMEIRLAEQEANAAPLAA